VTEVSSELRDVGELSLLAARPRGRNPGHGSDQELMVSLDVELAALKQKTKVADC
jgi:hypothetical protein